MLLLLPPSETKRDGGGGGPLDLGALHHPALTRQRRDVLEAVRGLAATPEAMMRALKLGPRQASEVERNAAVTASATMPAIDRYTGVLYDALDAATLTPAARERAGESVRIHSALLGPVSALDPIPAYRLSHDSRLPGLPLKRHWSEAVSRELERHEGLLLDLRSEGYTHLGPAPRREESLFLRVVTRGSDGAARALNHFNKKSKGLFVRSLLGSPELPVDLTSLLDWASRNDWRIRQGAPGELELLV